MIRIDDISLLVTCSPELGLEELEQHLKNEGYTLGFFHPRQKPTLGRMLEKNIPNWFYRLYGHPRDFCMSLAVRTENGELIRSKRTPRSATGPNLHQLLVGSPARWGLLEEMTLKLHPIPEQVEWHWTYWPETFLPGDFLRVLQGIHIIPSYVGVFAPKDLPTLLQQGERQLISLRFVGLTELVRCYAQRATALAVSLGGEVPRTARRRAIPLLEELMAKGYQ